MKSILLDRGFRPPVRMPFTQLRGTCSALLATAAVFGAVGSVQAQSDNFDSGALGPAWSKAQFFPQNYTFVDSGAGKALRIQANPVPDAAPAAAAITQTNIYTDFYVAVDVVDWAIKDQALVLLAQWTPGGAAGLAEGTGMILNYDVAQDGEGDGDRKGGQLQINSIAPGFAASTKAAADITLEPGRSYRMVFQGVGTIYTGRVYDLHDLTKPLVTIEVDDSTYNIGQSGFLSFSRNGTAGVTDVTIDNYVASAADPNTALAPALPHPVAGTPFVVTRTPSKRFTNFHPVASGISFQAQTLTSGQINAAATKLFLNGTDVSASLAPLPANGSTVSFTTAAGTLKSNMVYSARIEVQDTTGSLRSTNTFWFDTFTDAYLATAPVRTIEAEDYNYGGGQAQLGAIPVSGLDQNGNPVAGNGSGYFALVGTPEVDYFKPGGFYNLDYAEYRPEDRVQITQGAYQTLSRDEAADIVDKNTTATETFRFHDTQRSQYTAAKVYEYQVRLTSPGDWMNYTRSFTAGKYQVYVRVGSFDSTVVHLDRVTSDPTALNQTTARLGTFNIPNHFMRLNYHYVPLVTDAGAPAVLDLSGTQTLRLTLGGNPTKDARLVSLDYLLLVPAPAEDTTTIFDDFNDGNDTVNPAWDRYDPIGGLTAPPAQFTFPDGHYRIVAPAQQAPNCDAGPARAGSFIRGATFDDFHVSVDVIDFDDTVRQAFGIGARIVNPGLGTTGGYFFSWEPGGGVLPGENNGDLDISILVDEAAVGQIETAPSGLHLSKGKNYRFVFMGTGNNFEARVYELPDTFNPLIVLPGTDPDNTYTSGQVGLIVASNGDCEVGADATWDNFLVKVPDTTPSLAISASGNNVTLTWSGETNILQTSPSLSNAQWTAITTGITVVNGQSSYTTPVGTGAFYRLVTP